MHGSESHMSNYAYVQDTFKGVAAIKSGYKLTFVPLKTIFIQCFKAFRIEE
jgi:hypothetical protein